MLLTGDDKVIAGLARVAVASEKNIATFRALGRTADRAMNFGKMAKEADKATTAIDGMSKAAQRSADASYRAEQAQSNWFAHIMKTTVLSAAVNKSFMTIVDAMGQAVRQADLIEGFPQSMAAIGISANDSAISLQKLSSYVGDVGGNLTDAVKMVQRFTSVNNNVKASTAMYAGLTNAMIANNTVGERQSQVMEQVAQSYSKGRFDGQEFRAMIEGLGPAANLAAQALGYMSAIDIQSALADGTVSMSAFMSELTRVSLESGPIMDQVAIQMNGIEFAQTSMRNALVNGLTEIYLAVGRQNIVAVFRLITQTIGVLFTWVVNLINAFRALLNLLFGANLEPITGDTAENLSSGASSANEMGKGLDKAGKSAKKLRNQLAGFDKMNVLTEPPESSGSGDSGGAAPAGFDPGQTALMEDLFDKMRTSIQEASIWAKILAGIIAALAANSLLGKIFGTSPLAALRDGLKGATKDTNDAGAAMKGLGKDIDDTNKKGDKTPKIFGMPRTPVLLAGAAIVALGLGIAYLYQENEDFARGFDKVWQPILWLLQTVGGWVGEKLVGAFNWLGEALDGIVPPDFSNFLKDLGGMEALGIAAGVAVAGFAAVATVAAANYAIAWTVASAKASAAFIRSIAVMSANLAAKAAQMAVSWAVALGPIGLIGLAVAALVALIIMNWDTIVEWFTNFWDWLVEKGLGAWEWIKEAFSGVSEFFIGIWDGVKEIFTGFIDFISEWGLTILAVLFFPFSLALGLIIQNWDTIKAFFSGVWEFIKNVFSPVIEFLVGMFRGAWDGIVNIWNVVSGWFGSLWDSIKKIFSVVGKVLGDYFKGAWNSIKNIWNVVANWFRGIWNNIKNVFSPVTNWFKGIFQGAWNAIKNVFSAVGGFFRGIWNTIKSIFGSIGGAVGDAIGGAFRGAINGVLGGATRIINGFIRTINLATSAINSIPGVNIPRINELNVPHLALGGVVDRPTLAMVGEAGTEAVMPLENNTGWIDNLASKINTSNGQNVEAVGDMPVTNTKEQAPMTFNINLSGIVATSPQEKRKLAEVISKEIDKLRKKKGGEPA